MSRRKFAPLLFKSSKTHRNVCDYHFQHAWYNQNQQEYLKRRRNIYLRNVNTDVWLSFIPRNISSVPSSTNRYTVCNNKLALCLTQHCDIHMLSLYNIHSHSQSSWTYTKSHQSSHCASLKHWQSQSRVPYNYQHKRDCNPRTTRWDKITNIVLTTLIHYTRLTKLSLSLPTSTRKQPQVL